MRTLRKLRVGDVVTSSVLGRDDYFLVTHADSSIELVNIGPDRFRDVVLTPRLKTHVVNSIDDLGIVRRHTTMNRRVVFSRR
jgi:hypothetical protein